MLNLSPQEAIININRPVFTSKEISALTERSLSSVSTTLKRLKERGTIRKIYRGVWANANDPRFNLFSVAQFLLAQQTYISFISALHVHGIISQIPKVVYAATTAHTKTIKTTVAAYSFHQISPDIFRGFDWHGGKDGFLIATAEKALVDCLYISSRKGNRFYNFPELDFTNNFSFSKARKWASLITDNKIKNHVVKRLNELSDHR